MEKFAICTDGLEAFVNKMLLYEQVVWSVYTFRGLFLKTYLIYGRNGE